MSTKVNTERVYNHSILYSYMYIMAMVEFDLTGRLRRNQRSLMKLPSSMIKFINITIIISLLFL